MGSRRVRVSQRGGDWLGEIIMASHSGLRIGKRGGRRVGGTGHVGAHGGVAHRVAPVDEPLLPRGVEPLQPRLHLRHFPRPLGRAREAGARVLGDVGPTRAIENLRAQTGRVKIGTIFVSFAQVFGGLADGAFGRILSSLKPRLLTCTVAGLAYGVLLAWLAAGAAGYDGDSLPLSLVLMFMLGFPVSLPLCAFSGYFIALSVPLLWMGFGAAVCFAGASGRAYRLGTRLLVVHYIGVLIGMLAIPWAVESSAHISAKGLAAIALVLCVYAVGQVAWWRAIRFLDRSSEGTTLPRAVMGPFRLGRLVAGVLALTGCFVVLAEHETLSLTCRHSTGDCEIVRAGWRTSARRVPIEAVTVSFGVPRSRLEVASAARKETLIGVGCIDRKPGAPRLPGAGLFSRCESHGGQVLAAVSEFLGRERGADLHVAYEDPWPSRALAAVLGALGLSLVASAFLTLRARSMIPTYRRPASRPPVARPPLPPASVYPRRRTP